MVGASSYKFFKKLIELPCVEEIILYGSRARGDNQERSDIDLAIVCPSATQKEWHKILEIIENADTLLKIDCVRLDTLSDSSEFKKNILQDKQVLYRKSVIPT